MTKLSHSDKALQTLALTGTTVSQWSLVPFRWVLETREVPTEVTCPTCKGRRFVVRDAQGAILPEPAHAYGFTEADQANRTALVAWNELFKAQNPDKGAWSTGNCPSCLQKKKPYGYRTGRAVRPVPTEVEVGYPQWVEGSVFDSRFHAGCSCGLCGKTVLKSRLVPIHATDANGKTHNMNVGEDCAKSLLNIKTPAKAGKKIIEVSI